MITLEQAREAKSIFLKTYFLEYCNGVGIGWVGKDYCLRAYILTGNEAIIDTLPKEILGVHVEYVITGPAVAY